MHHSLGCQCNARQNAAAPGIILVTEHAGSGLQASTKARYRTGKRQAPNCVVAERGNSEAPVDHLGQGT